MGKYIWPCLPHHLSDDWNDHVSRGSLGGADVPCSYGTPLQAMAAGRVSIVSRTNTGSGGRYVRITSPDGDSVEYLHMSEIFVSVGDRLDQGEVFGKSGASAYGSDYGTGGPHVHVHGVHSTGIRFDVMPEVGLSGYASLDVTILQPEKEKIVKLINGKTNNADVEKGVPFRQATFLVSDGNYIVPLTPAEAAEWNKITEQDMGGLPDYEFAQIDALNGSIQRSKSAAPQPAGS